MHMRSAFAALVVAAALVAPAAAKQCIWNKGGYVLRVDWFKNTDLSQQAGANGIYEYTFTGQPVQTDVFATANGRCISRGSTAYVAVVSIEGGNNNNRRIVAYPEDWPPERRIQGAIEWADTPSTSRYEDFWGTIFNPQHGPGGPV